MYLQGFDTTMTISAILEYGSHNLNEIWYMKHSAVRKNIGQRQTQPDIETCRLKLFPSSFVKKILKNRFIFHFHSPVRGKESESFGFAPENFKFSEFQFLCPLWAFYCTFVFLSTRISPPPIPPPFVLFFPFIQIVSY